MPPRVDSRLALLSLLCVTALTAQPARTASMLLEGDFLRFAAPPPHFLSGKTLERLRSGESVSFAMRFTLSAESAVNLLRRNVARCVVSYDLWEEKFSVALFGEQTASVSHLSAVKAESWCVGRMRVSANGLEPGRSLQARLEIRAENGRDRPLIDEDSAVNLARLIELFGRRPESSATRWIMDSGAFRLQEVPKVKAGERP